MTGEKFEVAKKELLKAIKQLRSHQHFYIVFFDRGVLQMLGRNNVKDMLPATPKNLRQVEYWIRRVKVGSGTKPYQSIRLALALDPDTMFLLSDGQFNSGDNTVSYLVENRTVDGDKFDRAATDMKLNTIGFYHKGDGTLQRLAERFNGTYRFIAGEDR